MYSMPASDPRVLDATEDDVLVDLLIRFMQDRTTAAEIDPSEAARQFAEEHPQEATAMLKAHEDWLDSDKVRSGIQAILGRKPAAPPPEIRISVPTSKVRP